LPPVDKQLSRYSDSDAASEHRLCWTNENRNEYSAIAMVRSGSDESIAKFPFSA